MKNISTLKYNYWITIAVTILFVFVGYYVFRVCDLSNKQIFEVMKFILFCSVYLEAFGCVLVKQLCKIKMPLSHRLLISFFVGFMGTVLLYALCSLLSILTLFPFIVPVYIVFVILYKYYKKEWNLHRIYVWCKECKVDNSALVLCFQFLIICVIYLALPKVNLESANKLLVDADGTWHVGNIAALSQGLPASDFRVLGKEFFYHYFSDLLLGISKHILGISAYNLFYFYMPLLVAFLLSLSIWSLFGIRSSKARWIKCNYIFFAGMAVYRVIVNGGVSQGSIFHLHLFTNVNGVAMITASMIAVIVFLDKIQQGEFSSGNGLVMGVLVGALTGFKGPIGLAFVFAFIGVIFVKGLIEKKCTKNLLQYCILSCLAFCVVYIFVIVGWRTLFQSDIPMSDTSKLFINPIKTLQRTCLSNYVGELPYILLVVIMYVLAFTPIVGIFVGDSFCKVLRCIRMKNVGSITDYIVIAMIYIGMGGYLLTAQSGYSQLYFLFMSIPLMIYYVVECKWRNKKGVKIFYWAVIGISLMFGTRDFYKDVVYRIEAARIERDIVKNAQAADNEYHTLTRAEIDGLLWIRDNTDKHSIIISDRQSLGRYGVDRDDIDCRFFGYSAIAERQIYLEGFYYSSLSRDKFDEMYEVQECIYNMDNEDVGFQMQRVGAEYLIVSKRFTDRAFSESVGVKCVFSNKDIDIYQYCK